MNEINKEKIKELERLAVKYPWHKDRQKWYYELNVLKHGKTSAKG